MRQTIFRFVVVLWLALLSLAVFKGKPATVAAAPTPASPIGRFMPFDTHGAIILIDTQTGSYCVLGEAGIAGDQKAWQHVPFCTAQPNIPPNPYRKPATKP